ncbi:uncharacterized protein LOC141602200 [Silene latifolia]|uniref:uncharacterized protein LOC141602200 n=1 Tax=Silene latifolia TaxID=37657 RepID=UPI003D7714F0
MAKNKSTKPNSSIAQQSKQINNNNIQSITNEKSKKTDTNTPNTTSNNMTLSFDREIEVAKIRAEVTSLLHSAGIVIPEAAPVTESVTTEVVMESEGEEIDYWSFSIYGYVMGANPPWRALEGYLRREWKDYEIAKVAFLPNGLFVVRFATMEHRKLVLEKGMFLFDGKPVIVRPWEPNTKITKVSVKIVPIWVKLMGLDLKFWGAKCLEKLATIIGKFVRVDDLTLDKYLLGFARVMVEGVAGSSQTGLAGIGNMVQNSGKGIMVTPTVTPVNNASNVVLTPARILTRITRHELRLAGVKEGASVKDIKWCLHQANVDLFGLLETRVKPGSLNKVVDNLCTGWNYTTNHQFHVGGRIWLLWKVERYDVDVLDMDAQYIHIKVKDIITNCSFFATYVYGFNKVEERVPLWDALIRLTVRDPWIVLGDFNNVLHMDEKIGLPVKDIETIPFQHTIDTCGLRDMKSTGSFFTWNNKQPNSTRVFSRIDRVLVNDEWIKNWHDHYAYYAPKGDYDHFPCFIQCGDTHLHRKRPFKFFNMWTGVPEFKNVVEAGWKTKIQGTLIYKVVRKLKLLKNSFKELNKELFSDVEKNSEIAYEILLHAQKQLQMDPNNRTLMDNEYNLRGSFQMLHKAKLEFLKQKAKCKWAQEGDANTTLFHRAIKQRQLSNKVMHIQDKHGVICNSPETIMQAFVDYYQDLLGSNGCTADIYTNIVTNGVCLTSEDWNAINREPSKEEIKSIMTSIPDVKSPGPDGYSSYFFKAGWDIIGDDRMIYVRLSLIFFKDDQMLKQLNSTTLVLIPKVQNPSSVKEFRPIACCNSLFKVISKVLCDRLATVLPKIISPTQAAFIKGRSIWGTLASIFTLVKAFDCFTKASGLHIISDKTDIMFNGVHSEVEEICLPKTGFKKGNLPFKYLGVNISHKKLSKVDCAMLVEKLTHRFKDWNKKRISYTGRLILVKSILVTLHNYWAQIFFLPVGVMERIQALCRNFLWEGTDSYSKAPLVSWKVVCMPLLAGGLGVLDSRVWNIAAVGKLVWWIVAKKDILWIKWIDKIYLKGRDWANYQPSLNSSWAWRQVCSVNDKLMGGYVDGKWLGKNGNYTIVAGYEWLRQVPWPKVNWYTIVWNKINTPKHCFTAWLIQHGRLLTLDRLCKMGVTNQKVCFLCGEQNEDHDHLFKYCRYTCLCYNRIQNWLNLRGGSFGNAGEMLKSRHYSGFIRKLFCSLVLATQYHVWYARNICRLEHRVLHPKAILQVVQEDGRMAILKYKYHMMSQIDRNWCRVRGLMS